jgi:hypothetical protein
MTTRCLLIAIFCSTLVGCSSTSQDDAALRPFSETAAREFYQRYEASLKAHRGDTIAAFYHSDGALIILNGVRAHRTNAGLDSIYRLQWRGPVFFAFDSLRFEPLGTQRVLVTGGFRWLRSQSPDTGRFAYLSVLERTASGLRIRVEHETRLPPQR